MIYSQSHYVVSATVCISPNFLAVVLLVGLGVVLNGHSYGCRLEHTGMSFSRKPWGGAARTIPGAGDGLMKDQGSQPIATKRVSVPGRGTAHTESLSLSGGE